MAATCPAHIQGYECRAAIGLPCRIRTRGRLKGTAYKTFQAIAAPRTNSANATNVELNMLSSIGLESHLDWRGGSDDAGASIVAAAPPEESLTECPDCPAGFRQIVAVTAPSAGAAI